MAWKECRYRFTIVKIYIHLKALIIAVSQFLSLSKACIIFTTVMDSCVRKVVSHIRKLHIHFCSQQTEPTIERQANKVHSIFQVKRVVRSRPMKMNEETKIMISNSLHLKLKWNEVDLSITDHKTPRAALHLTSSKNKKLQKIVESNAKECRPKTRISFEGNGMGLKLKSKSNKVKCTYIRYFIWMETTPRPSRSIR